ncbi:hypothetical protein ASD67_00125 [Sphingopyxis sp. Root1497]|uniref:hypothetical protein n=1 Tax=Sphingopyxis sp. Root1497 TaxID=1736474 RepID=UPI000701122F|nr:hypothetical protein [Sphingopyxis sp. Root1497]KQZ65562.1 hypothetical protein ASD67_00125 [Sphingopyxis sp. Root1497]
MGITYRHSNGAGGHSFYPGVIGTWEWDDDAHTLTMNFEDGETRTFGPNAEGEPFAYGRLLYRDAGTYIDEETGEERPAIADSDPSAILFNCTFWPVADGDLGGVS